LILSYIPVQTHSRAEPEMDCFLSQHSASKQWTAEGGSIDEVVSTLRRIVDDSPQSNPEPELEPNLSNSTGISRLRWMTSSERSTFLGSGARDVSTENGAVTVQFLRTSGQVGFRDLNTFVISKKVSETKLEQQTNTSAMILVTGTGRSLDYHMWTACPCCSGGACRYVACFCCCCGVCPTKDWGQNERTLDEIMLQGMTNTSTSSTSKVTMIPVVDQSAAVAQRTASEGQQKYHPPEVVAAER
jgi:hypothetical protein